MAEDGVQFGIMAPTDVRRLRFTDLKRGTSRRILLLGLGPQLTLDLAQSLD
jgi:hypothetical protein